MKGWGAATLVVIALLAGTAQAAPASGEFVLDAPLLMPAASTIDLAPKALYVNETRFLEALVLEAPQARIHVVEHRFLETFTYQQLTPPDLRIASFTLRDVRLELTEGNSSGWMGVLADSASKLTLSPTVPTSVEARDLSVLGDTYATGNTADASDPRTRAFAVHVTSPHIYASVPGDAALAGAFRLKLDGPDVTIHAAENTTRHATGKHRSGDAPVREVVERVLFLEIADGSLRLASGDPIMTAADVSVVAWDGKATFRAVRGGLTTADAMYQASNERVMLHGDFTASLRPFRENGAVVASASVQGSLDSTTMAAASAMGPQGAVSWAPWLTPVLLLGAVMGVAGMGWSIHRRRRAAALGAPPGKPWSVDELVALGNLAIEGERYAEALEWLARARAMAPHSARLMMDAAFCHETLGEVREALDLYDAAAASSADGEADFLAARLLLTTEGASAEAERHAVRALRRQPMLAFECRDDAAFASLRARPAFARVLGEALERVE